LCLCLRLCSCLYVVWHLSRSCKIWLRESTTPQTSFCNIHQAITIADTDRRERVRPDRICLSLKTIAIHVLTTRTTFHHTLKLTIQYLKRTLILCGRRHKVQSDFTIRPLTTRILLFHRPALVPIQEALSTGGREPVFQPSSRCLRNMKAISEH
jgi:hypothetical protein